MNMFYNGMKLINLFNTESIKIAMKLTDEFTKFIHKLCKIITQFYLYDSWVPVSYTHLDVYKRQELR